MSRLSLALLGPFQALLDGAPLVGLTSGKGRALLAYLAVEAGRPHPRPALAALFWPDQPDETALDGLRHALAQLRQALGEQRATTPFILAPRDALQFNPDADYELDVAAFRCQLGAERDTAAGTALEQALALYRGEFLAGLPGGYSAEFDAWVAFHRAELARLALLTLERLATASESAGDFARAEGFLRRALALEPWREEAHRELMRLLALSGQRSAALAQYEVCRRALRAELEVEPARETVLLYERLREGTLPPAPARVLPPGSDQVAGPGSQTAGSPATFVGREREIAWLGSHLEAALAGQGRVAFVTGEPGSGKTALLAEFARRAMERQAEVVVAFGSCNAQTGAGDPYLPFRDVLQLLASDVEAKRAADSLSPEHARRLWALLPEALAALVDHGPDLVDLLVPGRTLLARAQTVGPSGTLALARLEKLLQRKSPRAGAGAQQADLFEQVTRVLQQLARRQTLVIVLDDLQWADRGSLNLLFHLGRRLAGNSILLLGAYRSNDLALGRGGERHPLEPVVNELGRDFDGALLDLDQVEGRRFVDQLLDAEPNQLGAEFHERLYRRTSGHALFAVELLAGLKGQGDLVRDAAGRWVEGPQLDWTRLPARVEAATAERIGRLPRDLRRLLTAASVEGEEFTAEVVARVLDSDEREVCHLLSGPLSREHGLVVARSLRRVGGRRLSSYRFRHQLFQHYLYGRLDAVERAELHEAVGRELEALPGEVTGELAVQLARHFELAGLPEKAAGYLLRCGQRAMELLAHGEAVEAFRRALALLAPLPAAPARDSVEISLQLALGSALLTTEGLGSQGRIEAYARAYALSRHHGQQGELWPALHALASSSTSRGEYKQALELGEEMIALAQRLDKPAVLALAHFTLGATLFSSSLSLLRSQEHLEQALVHYDRECDAEARRLLTALNVFDVGVNARVWLADVLWLLGYPEQARRCSQYGLALAEQSNHFLSQVIALYSAGHVNQHRGDLHTTEETACRLERLVGGKNLLVGDVWVDVFSGWLQVKAGQTEEGLARVRRGTTAWQRTGAVFGTTSQLILLADACLLAGQVEEGLSAVDKGLALVERTGARPTEAELHRLRGELLLARQGAEDVEAAEACFQRALAVARSMAQRGWELRAATSLACHWRRQERQAEARALLAPVYAWFSEGFDTQDLRHAATLLQELGESIPSPR
ncbi:MAG: BREX system ATP-binding domain-containing protein [Chloroflexota bacterium]